MGKRLSSLLIACLVVLLFASCQTAKTKKEICGEWSLKGGVSSYFFHKDNTYEHRQVFQIPGSIYFTHWEEKGVYKIDGRNIIVTPTLSTATDFNLFVEKTTDTINDVTSKTLHLKDENTLYYGSDEYIKAEDY